jgi:D-xylose transport system substrate-binding protein
MTIRNLLMVVSLVLSVIIGLVLSRGGGSESAATSEGSTAQPLIGLSLDTLKEARWQADRDLFVKSVTELGGRVDVQSANGDDNQQIRDVESLLTAGVRVLVIVPHDGVAMARAVEMANKANVPVISYDRLIRDSNVDLYISFDNERVGELQAKFLADRIKSGSKMRLLRIYGAPTDNNAKQFKQGQDNILNPLIKSGAVQVVHQDWAEDWRPENAKRIANAAITSTGGKFDAVLASNDGTAGGAIQALVEAGLADKVLVTGQDAELTACQRIARGTQSMTVYKPIKRLSSRVASAAMAMAKSKPIIAGAGTPNGKIDVPSILEDVSVVTKDNLVQTVIKDGFHSYDEIYRDVPQNQRPPRS